MGTAYDIDPWVRPPVGRGPDGTSRLAAANAAGPSADFSFADLLDVINPLQHIPLVSSIYRRLTGDEISPHARIIGATLYGGPLGLVIATQVALVEQASGKSIATIATAGLFDKPETEEIASAEDTAAAIEIAPASGRDHHETAALAPDEASPAVTPEPAGAAYSGQAALRAYLNDLQTQGEPEEESGDPAFTQKMMEGLRKYESMARSGASGYPARAPQDPDTP